MLSANLFLASLAILIFVMLIVLGAVIYYALKRNEAKPGSDPQLVKLRFDSLRSSFKQAVELIEANIAGRGERYSIPWVLLLNEGPQVRQLPIEQAGVASALSTESASAAATQGIAWHFFDKGIVIDMQGSYLGSPDAEDAAEKPWDEFLGLCRSYRPQRPFDSVVITVPATLLQEESSDSQLELVKLARIAHRRLWLAQNRFAMRFAVYVVISECERIEGFSPFARALPEAMRAGMLGWSSPYDLSTTYQSTWVDNAMSSVVQTVSETSAELFAIDAQSADASKFFLLPSRIQSLSAQLQVYVDELMRPSAYHEPFFFRGLYLTGDSSQAAQAAGMLGLGNGDAEGATDSSLDSVSQLSREPAFLRDLFEKKIFSEYGIARPSRQQLTRPVASSMARWGAGVLLGGWAVGLAIATYQLDRRNPELVKALAQIEIDTNFRARASELNEVIPIGWYREKTLSLLAEIEKLGADKAWTFFMPGAWKIFDDLDQRAATRIEREFGEIAINTLRRELYAKASEITGVAQDDSTAELIIGGECKPPAGFTTIFGAPHKSTLAIEDLPEFSALLNYLTALDRLDQAIGAMVRLQKPGQGANDDLRLLVKYTLGAELPENISQSIRLFRGSDESGRVSPAAINVSHIRQAANCSLVKGLSLFDKRIFLDNDLLMTERLLTSQSAEMFGGENSVDGFVHTLTRMKETVATIKEQEALLESGKGAWIRQPTLSLGKSYETLLARIGQSTRLLGLDSANAAAQRSADAFGQMRAEFQTRFGAEGQPGIVWNEKTMRFELSSERVALRNALVNLLSQPFMSASSNRDIPSSAAPNVLAWDSAKLDQALKLADIHKAFLAEGLAKFPALNRADVSAFVDEQFARLIGDMVVDGLSMTGRTEIDAMMDATLFDASRVRLAKVQELLTQLRAENEAQDLASLVSEDALQRLKQLDQKLSQLDLYAIRGRDMRGWTGDGGPMLSAFDVSDASSLQQYLALQFGRIELLGRQSSVYLASLDNKSDDLQVARRWNAINKELERYRLKNPNSSLLMLEQFILSNGVETNRSNCAERLTGKAPPARSSDVFSEKHAQLYSMLQQRCTDLRNSEQMDQWVNFSNGFNQMLAGRHPFALLGSNDAGDADFDDVGTVLKSFDKIGKPSRQIGTVTRRTNGGAYAVQRFTEQFERVKTFLAPLYPADDGAVAGYDLLAEFRVNQASEIEGNKIIDWTLEVGSQSINLRDAPRPLRWEPATPIVITLRLAKDSQVVALADPQQSNMSTDGRNVTFKYDDTWSLLRLIQRQRDASSARTDGKSQLIRLEFPVAGGSEGLKSSGHENRARVYLRLSVLPVGKRSALVWPIAFPVRAPDYVSP